MWGECGLRRGACGSLLGRLDLQDRPREEDPERRPATGLARELDVAARLLDDAIDRREPEPGPPPLLLGREERLEDAFLRLAIHAGAGVAHRHHDILTRREAALTRRERRGHVD